MRHAPFFGWIHDLSAPDPTTIFNLFGLIPWDPSGVPLIGHFLMLGVWPLIMGFTMFVQQRMNPAPADPIQQQIFLWMPVLFTFMLASFPAGLPECFPVGSCSILPPFCLCCSTAASAILRVCCSTPG